jgi:hypothetical protein
MGPKSYSVPHYFFRSSIGAISTDHVFESENINQQEERQPMDITSLIIEESAVRREYAQSPISDELNRSYHSEQSKT